MPPVRTRLGNARSRLRTGLERALGPLRADLAADPYLRYLLAFALFTCGFGAWFRLPSFAEPDEFSRLLQPMKAAGNVAADPGFDSLAAGITDGRALGATFYLYALTLAPVFLAVLAAGQFETFAGLGALQSRWDLWHAAPAWFWTAAVGLGRVASVGFGVGSVYLTYRLGVALHDRTAGRLAALALALSVGFFATTHVVGEDPPMLFFLLLTVVLAHRYVETGRRDLFLWGALTGGLAIAFKLSGGAGAVVLGVAFVERARRQDDPVAALARPGVVGGGLVVGGLAVSVGIPSVLVGGPTELLTRVTSSIGYKTGRAGSLAAPLSYWLLRSYVAATGIGLFALTVGGVAVAGGRALVRRRPPRVLSVLLVATAGTFLLVYSRFEFVRVRHVVPTLPPLFVLAAAEVARWSDVDPGTVGRRALTAVLALVLVTTVLFAGVAEYGYVADPRDRATEWLDDNAGENATVEVYENSIADVGVPHGQRTVHYEFPEENATRNPSLVENESAYTEWMLDMPERRPDYVQLTGGDLGYLDPTNPDSERFPDRREYVRALLAGEYDYTVAAEFGRRPQVRSLRDDFRQATLRPDVDGQETYVVILERDA